MVVVGGVVEGGGGRGREGGGRMVDGSGGGVVVVVSDELTLHTAVCFVIHSCKHYVRCKYCMHDIDSVA